MLKSNAFYLPNDAVTGIDPKKDPRMFEAPTANISWVASIELDLATKKLELETKFVC